MPLPLGARFGSYEILGPLGAGGMGEVYRARDSKLPREVALKILPEPVARDPERLARFDRESQVLASLNHPHIAHLYGIEELGPVRALVMELVEGSTLAELIASEGEPSHGPLPIGEVLDIARQIADALAAAHELGIILRDLKPANVKVTPDGTVKVLDFGLAKASEGSGPPIHLENSPTITSPAAMTSAGVILGTAAYMSPEQARGRAVDRRADLWAFGAVLYELLTGRQAFEGETVTDVLAAVVKQDPDWSRLPADTPPAIHSLLRRCLERDRRRRLGDAAEARFQIEEVLNPSGASTDRAPTAADRTVVPSPATRSAAAVLVPWTLAALFAIGAGALAWRAWSGSEVPVSRYSIEAPAKASVSIISRPSLAISPDGSTVVFAAESGGVSRLYVRSADDFEPRLLAGTDGASHPVISPDGRWVAFMGSAGLSKIPITGGPVVSLAPVSDPRGLSWDTDDTLTFSPDAIGGISRISSAGGTPEQLTTIDEAKGERTHRWAQMLPGGTTIIFTVGTLTSPDSYEAANIEAQRLDTGERKVIVRGASMALYVPSGYLVFGRQRILYAVKFDPEQLEVRGTPVPVVHGVAGDALTGAVHVAVSRNGTLAYLAWSAEGTQHFLTWLDVSGRAESLDLPAGTYFDPALSPDGRRLAVIVAAGGGQDVWVHDLERKTFTRLTFGGTQASPAWTPDGRTIYYTTRRSPPTGSPCRS